MRQLNSRARWRSMGVVAGVFALAVVAAVQWSGTATARPAPAPQAPAVAAAPPSSTSFADLVDAVAPAVVNISSSGSKANAGNRKPSQFQVPPNSPFRDFFEHFFDQPQMPGHSRPLRSQGSGFVVDPSGYIVTNFHVVDGAEKITVKLQGGEELRAVIRGFDAKTDLAVLRVEPHKELPYVEFGDSESARVGDWVLAIGNPFGLGGTATTGIISARGRDIRSGPLDDFLQIDAPINRGNSGGPLFDVSGKVIGVNTAIYSPNGGSVGIGFAIPSTLARSVIDQLIAEGMVDRGWLGVQIQSIDSEIAASLGLEDTHGALVTSVVKNSPSNRAGIEPGDVIVEYQGKTINKLKDLPRLVANTPAEETVELKLLRAGKERTLEVVVGRSQRPVQAAMAVQPEPNDNKAKLGLTLAELTAAQRNRYQLDDDVRGVLVVAVDPQGPAARKGLRPGDVITRVGSRRVETPEDVVEHVEGALGDHKESVLLLIERRGNERFVAVRFA